MNKWWARHVKKEMTKEEVGIEDKLTLTYLRVTFYVIDFLEINYIVKIVWFICCPCSTEGLVWQNLTKVYKGNQWNSFKKNEKESEGCTRTIIFIIINFIGTIQHLRYVFDIIT